MPSGEFKIVIDGCTFDITESLHQAFSHMYENELKKPMWVDSVCIRQDDEEEKAEQIKLMPTIYGTAEHVIVWLGHGDVASRFDDVIVQLDDIGAKAVSCGIFKLSGEELQNLSNVDPMNPIRVGIEEIFRSISGGYNRRTTFLRDAVDKLWYERDWGFPLKAFLDIMELPWFSRVWVVQELLIPPEGCVSFAVGHKRISFENLISGYQLFTLWIGLQGHYEHDHPIKTIYRLIKNVARTGYHMWGETPKAAKILGWRLEYLRDKSKTSLKYFLKTAYVDLRRGMECSKDEDRIYALVGITNDFSFLGESAMYYKRELEVTYRLVAVHLISLGHVDILSLCKNRNPSFPSWVPDWREFLPQPWGHFIEDGLFCASRDARVSMTEIPHLHMIELGAWTVDTIQDIGFEWIADIERNSLKGTSSMFRIITTFLERSRYSPKEREKASWMIPIGGKECDDDMQIRPATELSHTRFHSYKKAAKFTIDHLTNSRPKAMSYFYSMAPLSGHRPFLSTTGYVGLCPENTLPGDEIYIISGAHVPYVVRPTADGTHELIGEAFVYGIMHGEFIDGLGDSRGTQALRLV